jgi:tripartite-type tricarboxylate transporter receptor subunit TctC
MPWWALFAPKETPQPILDGLSDALDRALDDTTVRRRLAEVGCEVPDNERRGQKPLSTLVRNEMARWIPIIKAANIKLE